MKKQDVIIIGASASGLMCAIEAGRRGRKVVVLDHANQAGKKILMSGGGRCNFTNLDIQPEHYISHNPHFCKSALNNFNQRDFITLVQRHNIPFHERSHGQLFCDNSARDILNMLLNECKQSNINILLGTDIENVSHGPGRHFSIKTSQGDFQSTSLVVATGGLSIPATGASPYGYKIAEQFGIKVWPVSAGLVPLTLNKKELAYFSPLSGIAVDSIVSCPSQDFRENILFTHRGLSGPAILQVSSYWKPGEDITINLLPDVDLVTELKAAQAQHAQMQLKTFLGGLLPRRLVSTLISRKWNETPLQEVSHNQFDDVAKQLQQWTTKPNGTEGYRTAEVTLGGVDCDALSSKTMECRDNPGLYFIGEVVDITGWLGGYNFQWAWSSGWAAGQYV
ncbi:MAG TPA: NAD(P)/FAD-dependent oxidoreductase [Gammaproteobacteria bacterium]|nr:NAD(P)/FAD-dependent oxidoreductase [Gammaproteobacteria bacterium]